MASDESALYKIDYTTMLVQPDSKLCNIPNEILHKICENLFPSFSLQIELPTFLEPGDHTTPVSAGSAITMIDLLSTTDLEILQSCKVLRQKLLPLLANLTDHTFTVARILPSRFEWRDFEDYTGPRIVEIKLGKLFRAKIKKLVLTNYQAAIPNPSIFENLEEIQVNSEGGFPVISRDIWNDNGKLLRACRANIDGSLTHEEFDSSGLYRRPGRPVAQDRWILQMAEKLKMQEPNREVRVIISQRVYDSLTPRGNGWRTIFGKVWYDVTAGKLTNKTQWCI